MAFLAVTSAAKAQPGARTVQPANQVLLQAVQRPQLAELAARATCKVMMLAAASLP